MIIPSCDPDKLYASPTLQGSFRQSILAINFGCLSGIQEPLIIWTTFKTSSRLHTSLGRGHQVAHTITNEMINLTLAQAPAFHPHLLITLPKLQSRPSPASTYHVSLTLPDAIFVDRDEIIDLWGQSSSAGRSRRKIEWDLSPKNIDIERPVRNTTEVTSLRLAFSGIDVLDVPLHARYLEPNDHGAESITLFQDGAVEAGWDCAGLHGKANHACSRNTADASDTSCLSAIAHAAPLKITLPSGRTSDRAIVELATPIVIWLGWLYLFVKVWTLSKRTRHIKTD